jgi:uncharacterized protein (DUF433 family)
MEWNERIKLDPAILAGKPVVQGTRLSVSLIIDLLAQGWSKEDLFESYPQLQPEDVRACLAYASEVLQAERVYPVQAP